MNHSFKVDCKGTRHFYSMVRILNKQIGFGNWTTEGRPVRKLRRLSLNNILRNRLEIPQHSMPVTFRVPEDHSDIESVLNLWGDTDGAR